MRSPGIKALSGLVVLSTFQILPTTAAPALLPSGAADQCVRETLSPPHERPVWLSAAVWVPSIGNILAVDAGLNRLIQYSPTGEGKVLAQPSDEYPALLTTSGDRVLIKLVGQKVVSLDARLKDHQSHPLLDNVRTPLGPLNAVYQWTAVDHSVLAFGLVRGEGLPRGYQPGLFRIPTTSTGSASADLLQLVHSWDYYVLGYPYLASIASTGHGYFLNMDEGEARLFEIAPGAPSPRLLPEAIPPEFRRVQPLDAKMKGPEEAQALFAKLEQMKMVAGIYGAPDGKLYLLTREPAPKGVTDWWLFRIDPKLGRIEGKTLLPTSAKHLSIVPSPDTFYLFERGEVVGKMAMQTIRTLVTVPAHLLQRAPLRGIEACPRLRQ